MFKISLIDNWCLLEVVPGRKIWNCFGNTQFFVAITHVCMWVEVNWAMYLGAFDAKIVYSTVHLPHKGKSEEYFCGGNFFLVSWKKYVLPLCWAAIKLSKQPMFSSCQKNFDLMQMKEEVWDEEVKNSGKVHRAVTDSKYLGCNWCVVSIYLENTLLLPSLFASNDLF